MTSTEGPHKRRRVTQACDYCHRRSIRCRPVDADAQQRCVNCIDFDQACTRNRIVRRRGAKPRQASASASTPDIVHGSVSTEESPRNSGSLLATAAWSAPPVASQALVVDLIEIYFEVVYPIFPLFHRPSFLRKISRSEYTSNRELFAVTMAACALSSARVTDNALTNMTWDRQSLLSTSSVAFHEAAVAALPTSETPPQSLNLMRTYALLSLAAIQNGKSRDMQAYLGRYHALVAMDGLHDEDNWPRDLTIIELEERRRLYWSMYTLDIFSCIVFNSMIRSRDRQSNVRYPTELDDAFFDDTGYRRDPQASPNVSSLSSIISPDSWLHGYNIVTDLWRLLEHVTMKLHHYNKENRPFLEVTAHFGASPSAAMLQNEIDRVYYSLPRHFLVIDVMTGDRSRDLYGFQAANITATVQLLRMALLASEENTIEQRCQVVSEVVNAFVRIPSSYLCAISSPLLHHLSGIGSILGGVLQDSLNDYQYRQVRTVLLSLAQLLENLDLGAHSVQCAQKLRDLVIRIDNHMTSRQDREFISAKEVSASPHSLELPQDLLSEWPWKTTFL